MFSESCQIYAKHMGLYIQYVAFLVKLLLLIFNSFFEYLEDTNLRCDDNR